MILMTIVGSTIGQWWRRAILALRQPASRPRCYDPPEFYRFPPFLAFLELPDQQEDRI